MVGYSKKHILLALVPLSLALLLVAFTFVDLKISIAVYNRNSLFGRVFGVAAELPSRLCIPLLLTVIFYRLKAYSLVKFLIPPIMLATNYFWLEYLIPSTVGVVWFWVILALLSIAFTLFMLVVFSFIGAKAMNKLFIIILVLSVCVLVNTLLVTLIKIVWGRTRFYALGENYSGFSHWFIPQGITGNRSFPSGHTTSACSTLLIPITLYFMGCRRYKVVISLICTAIFIVLSATARVVLGAHYSSDVCFATILCTSMFAISFIILLRITDNKLQNSPLTKT